MNAKRKEILLATGLVILTVLTRFLPHAPNFSPVIALALFSGATFSDRRMAFALPMIALFLSDLILGFYDGISFVYLSYAWAIALGFTLNRNSVLSILRGSIGASVAFFLLSNLGVWFFSGLYPITASGLEQCFVMALPFFSQTLISTVVGAGVLFGIYAFVSKAVFAKVKFEKI